MAAKKDSKIPQAKLELYEKLIATNPGIERKGDVHPYTSVNGHMSPTSIRQALSASVCPRMS
jgi:hypothetical protein